MKTPRPAHSAMRSRTTYGVLAALCALLGGCQPGQDTAQPAPTPVRLAPVTQGPATPPLEFTGVVSVRDELKLAFKVGGPVARVSVREGDLVRAGQVLAQLDATEVGAQVEQARQLAEKAARDLARGEALHADQVIPLEQLQNLRTQAEVADAQLRSARFNRTYAAITAPADGVVLRRLVEERELVAPGQVVLVVGRSDSGTVARFAVSDRDVLRLARGQRVEVRLDAYPDRAFGAALSQIAGAADPASGLFPVEAALEPAPVTFANGLVGRVRLGETARDGAQLAYVPIGAVLEGDADRAHVFVADGTVARRRDVRVAFITADQVALREGVRPGEQVITAGAPYVEDGGAIAISGAP